MNDLQTGLHVSMRHCTTIAGKRPPGAQILNKNSLVLVAWFLVAPLFADEEAEIAPVV
jgi:hypothetical protein